MSQAVSNLVTPADPGALESKASLVIETTKPGITRLVTAVSGVAFVMAALTRTWGLGEVVIAFAGCLIGTALSAAGANALNQWYERERDAKMARTAGRPLPRGVLSKKEVLLAGMCFSVAGAALLWVTCGWVPALISAATIASYLFVYTPLKPVTTTSTLVGAVPGALPTLIGWTAGAGTAASIWEPAGWTLFAILFVWQVPHFLALAWKYRDDYQRGGYRVLPIDDKGGRRTSAAMAAWTACLLPVSVAPAAVMPDLLGPAFLAVSVVSGLMFAWIVSAVVIERTADAAMRVFFASIIHLPVLLVAMILDAAWHSWAA